MASMTAPAIRVTVNKTPGRASPLRPAGPMMLPLVRVMALVWVEIVSTVPVVSDATRVATMPEHSPNTGFTPASWA